MVSLWRCSLIPTIAPQLLDVTLRDGGYVNDWQFSIEDALAIISTLSRAGVAYIEVGYYRSRLAGNGAGKSGPSSCCGREYLEAVSRVRGDSKLTVMIHLNDVTPADYAFLADNGVSCARFIISTNSLPRIEPHIDAAHAANLSASVNLIRTSERTTENIVTCARAAEKMGADWLYIADSNGSLFPERVT